MKKLYNSYIASFKGLPKRSVVVIIDYVNQSGGDNGDSFPVTLPNQRTRFFVGTSWMDHDSIWIGICHWMLGLVVG
jgi:hypothetical protein